MRECLKKLKVACTDVDDVKWATNVEASGWLENIKLVLTCAIFMVELIDKKKASILCHCRCELNFVVVFLYVLQALFSDGWDRTSQLTSLAMLMLDGYYRTLRGFMVLIEKEWVSFGHKFRERSGHGDSNHKNDQQAPIFLQFIDCVWQILTQFPCSFEFNTHLLVFMMDSLHSCQYGTFLFDNEKEREEAHVREETTSVWSYVLNNLDEFTNVYYKENSENILIPNVSRARIQLWREYYLRWNWPAKSHYLRFHQYFPSEETSTLMVSQNTRISRSLSGLASSASSAPSSAAAAAVTPNASKEEEGQGEGEGSADDSILVEEEYQQPSEKTGNGSELTEDQPCSSQNGDDGDEDEEEEVVFDASDLDSPRNLPSSDSIPRKKEAPFDQRSLSLPAVHQHPPQVSPPSADDDDDDEEVAFVMVQPERESSGNNNTTTLNNDDKEEGKGESDGGKQEQAVTAATEGGPNEKESPVVEHVAQNHGAVPKEGTS